MWRSHRITTQNFYPRPPRGGRHWMLLLSITLLSNFYPRPPRGGRRVRSRFLFDKRDISIHALREEGDFP